jgi:hypothetical protein
MTLFQNSYQVYWDATSLSLLKECPRKYYYTIVQGLRPRGESVHLKFGTIFHTALEHYDRCMFKAHDDKLAEVVLEALRASWPWPFRHNLKTRYTLIRTIIWYLDDFQNDAARTVLLAEGAPAVELPFNFPIGKIHLCGRLDRLVSFQDGFYVMDRKTTGSTPSNYYFDGYSPDCQMSLYTIAGQVLWRSPVKGVILDVVQVAVGFSRFARGVIHRTPAQSSEWLEELPMWVEQAWRYTDLGRWPMNDKSCHKFGGCPFRSVCSKDPGVRDIFLRSNFEERPWNPLAA